MSTRPAPAWCPASSLDRTPRSSSRPSARAPDLPSHTTRGHAARARESVRGYSPPPRSRVTLRASPDRWSRPASPRRCYPPRRGDVPPPGALPATRRATLRRRRRRRRRGRPARATLFSHHPGLSSSRRARASRSPRAPTRPRRARPRRRAPRARWAPRVASEPARRRAPAAAAAPASRLRAPPPRTAAASDEGSSEPSSASTSAENVVPLRGRVPGRARVAPVQRRSRHHVRRRGPGGGQRVGGPILGLVQSSSLWGYTLTPLIGGVAADRYGGKAVLLGGILSGPRHRVHALRRVALLPAPVVRGDGPRRGVALPCMNSLMARWVPNRERSRAVAACMGGFQSRAWSVFWRRPCSRPPRASPRRFSSSASPASRGASSGRRSPPPSEGRRVGKAELALIEGGGSVVEKKEAVGGLPKGEKAEKKPGTPFRLLLSKPRRGRASSPTSSTTGGAYPPRVDAAVLQTGPGPRPGPVSYFSALPWATMAAACSRRLADHLIDQWGSRRRRRGRSQGVGFGGPAIGLLALTREDAGAGAAP